MSRVTSLYEIQTHVADYWDVAYNWGDDTHAATYQSAVTSGKGLIDQSIFAFKRKSDAWSLGAYATQYALGSSYDTPNFNVVKNKLDKNNVMVVNNTCATVGHLDGTWYTEHCKYSPGVANLDGYQPWVNYAYSGITIVPIFTMINPLTGAAYDWDYNNVISHDAEGWRCGYVDITVFGAPSNRAAMPQICQFAGSLKKAVISQVSSNLYTVQHGDEVTGVFYPLMPNTRLWAGYNVTSDNKVAQAYNTSQTCFFDITQMQWELTALNVPNSYRLTISFADAVRMINSLGFYWGKEVSAASSPKGLDCTDPNVVCPVIDPETHTVTDVVLEGEEIAEYAQDHIDDPYCNFLLDYGSDDGLTTDEYRENYDPIPATTEEADEIELNEPVIATSGGTSIWLMNEAKLKEFFTYLWNPDGTLFDDIVKGCALLGENPMDSVISCRFFPLDLSDVFNNKFDSQYRTIVFGRVPTTVVARHLTSSNVGVYDLGEFRFNDSNMFNDFRDYEPYSQYSLYLPFVGVVPLSAIECINTTIRIRYIIDLITGACTAVIYTNGVPYKYVDGMIGIEIPVTGRNMGQYGQQILGAALGGLGVGTKMGLKAASSMSSATEDWREAQGNTAKINMNTGHQGWGGAGFGAQAAVAAAPVALGAAFAIGGAAIGGMGSALLNNPSPQQSGSNVPAMGLSKPLYAYFIVQRSDSWIPANYDKLHGRLLHKGGKVGDFSGFSTFSNLKLENIAVATSEEKVLISKLLTSGVFI